MPTHRLTYILEDDFLSSLLGEDLIEAIIIFINPYSLIVHYVYLIFTLDIFLSLRFQPHKYFDVLFALLSSFYFPLDAVPPAHFFSSRH